MANTDIRTTARANHIPLWKIADHIGVSEATMTRHMRKELPTYDKERMMRAIHEIAQESPKEEAAC